MFKVKDKLLAQVLSQRRLLLPSRQVVGQGCLVQTDYRLVRLQHQRLDHVEGYLARASLEPLVEKRHAVLYLDQRATFLPDQNADAVKVVVLDRVKVHQKVCPLRDLHVQIRHFLNIN
jgi:hypothetical protein